MNQFERIVVINAVGDQGKSALSTHWLMPRLFDYSLLRIEETNSSDIADENEKIVANQRIENLFRKIEEYDNVVIDIGSSEYKSFIEKLMQVPDLAEEIDAWIIPVVETSTKAHVDTCQTVAQLIDLGVDPDTIKVVFNRVNESTNIKDSFRKIFENSGVVESLQLDQPINQIRILESEAFRLAEKMKQNITDVAMDTTNYRAEIRKAKEEQRDWTPIHDRKIAVSMARRLNVYLDTMFINLLSSLSADVSQFTEVKTE